ncbi:hypothetical protein [Candidatus Harpocratesius sp.]
MKKIKNTKVILIIIAIILIVNVSNLRDGVAHSPKYVDLKYYEQEQILSIYITHGVSDLNYHYVETVKIELYDVLNDTFKNENQNHSFTEQSILTFGSLNKTQEFIYHYTNQSTHQIFHLNISLSANEWTLINVTAICNLGGQFSNTMVVGHYPYYDVEHSMIEAVVPTIICSIVTMTPLFILRIVRRNKTRKINDKGLEV